MAMISMGIGVGVGVGIGVGVGVAVGVVEGVGVLAQILPMPSGEQDGDSINIRQIAKKITNLLFFMEVPQVDWTWLMRENPPGV
jgi:hypothetical protein